jgi:hypothetical protein
MKFDEIEWKWDALNESKENIIEDASKSSSTNTSKDARKETKRTVSTCTWKDTKEETTRTDSTSTRRDSESDFTNATKFVNFVDEDETMMRRNEIENDWRNELSLYFIVNNIDKWTWIDLSYFLTNLFSFVSQRKTCEWYLFTIRSFSFFYLFVHSLVFSLQHSLNNHRCCDSLSRIRRTFWICFSLSTISCFECKNYRSFSSVSASLESLSSLSDAFFAQSACSFWFDHCQLYYHNHQLDCLHWSAVRRRKFLSCAFTSNQINSDRNHWFLMKSAEESIISCLNELNESITLLSNANDDEIEW